jgi:hypothetical protein
MLRDYLTLGQTSMSIFPRSIAPSHLRQRRISLILDLRSKWSLRHCFAVSVRFTPLCQSGESYYIIAASVKSNTLSVLPHVASASPVDIEALASGETPDFGPDFSGRPLQPIDADRSPDFGPDFTLECSDGELMPDFGPEFDGDIEMEIEQTSHSNKSSGNFMRYGLLC